MSNTTLQTTQTKKPEQAPVHQIGGAMDGAEYFQQQESEIYYSQDTKTPIETTPSIPPFSGTGSLTFTKTEITIINEGPAPEESIFNSGWVTIAGNEKITAVADKTTVVATKAVEVIGNAAGAIGGAVQEGKDAVGNLVIKDFLGIGQKQPEKSSPEDQKKKAEGQFIIAKNNQLKEDRLQATQQEAQKIALDAIRIIGKAEPTAEDWNLVGINAAMDAKKATSTYMLAEIRNAQKAAQKAAQAAEKQQSTNGPSKKGAVGPGVISDQNKQGEVNGTGTNSMVG